MKHVSSAILLFLIIASSNGQQSRDRNATSESANSSVWVQTNGPGGGFVHDIVYDPYNSSVLYAIGSSEGIYRTSNSGESWEFLKFKDLHLMKDHHWKMDFGSNICSTRARQSRRF